MTPADVASQFESLGGGSMNANGWAFGCEFGFWQRAVGIEPIGLLRWASIDPANLQRGLAAQFEGISDPHAISMRNNPVPDWCVTQDTYRILYDHTGLSRERLSKDQAASRMAAILGRLAERLIEELTAADKMFTYHTYDHIMPDADVAALAAAVSRYGGATLFYVQTTPPDRPEFSAERKAANLIVGYIDRFAPRNGRIDCNPIGWEAVCRAALALRTRK